MLKHVRAIKKQFLKYDEKKKIYEFQTEDGKQLIHGLKAVFFKNMHSGLHIEPMLL